uniref:Uncharacterized protein n=1 Tax=Manihot esculenta TaxID=3983 RepID=A0A199UC23_MANES
MRCGPHAVHCVNGLSAGIVREWAMQLRIHVLSTGEMSAEPM